MSERDEFEKWWTSLGENLPKNGVVAAAWPDKDDCWDTWQAARAPLQERITALENKCALLAASWKKAEDELEKMRGFGKAND
jgi:hypothetical protein